MDTQTQQDVSLSGFVEKLLEEKGMTNLDPEVFEQVKKDLVDRVEDRINALVLRELPPEKLEDFEKVLDGGNDTEIEKFIEGNIEDREQKIAAELLAFRQTYLGM